MKIKIILMVGAVAVITGLFSLILVNCSPDTQDNLVKVNSFLDLHGLAVRQDGHLFIATHEGLLIMKNDKELYRVGNVNHDLMGFSMNPQKSDHVYASGHPSSGGNLGVIVSQDGGLNWKQIFRGIGGVSVDFHAMAIGLSDPRLIYGWYQDKLYRTEDGGNSWSFAGAKGLSNVFTLSTSPHDPDIVYAGTEQGLAISQDKGDTWSIPNPAGPVGGIAEDIEQAGTIYAFTQKYGLAVAYDSGKSWQDLNNGLKLGPTEAILLIAIHPVNSKVLYIGTTQKRIFKSDSRGQSWVLIK